MATEILHGINGYGITMRTKCQINYSITNKNWNDAYNMLLTKHNTNILKYSTRRSLQHWTEPSIVPNSREVSVWRNKKHPERTVSFVEDRSLTWSTSTSGSLEPMIPSRIMPIYLQLFFEMMIFRNSIQWMTKILSDDILDGLYKLIKNTRVWETQDRVGIVQYGDSPEESWTWLSQIEDDGEKKYRAPWSRRNWIHVCVGVKILRK